MFNMKGLYLCGRLLGVKSTPWKSDPTKFNHHVHVAVDTVNEWGEPSVDTKTVEVNYNDLQRIQEFCQANAGAFVAIPVGTNCKKQQRDGKLVNAWLSTWVPQGAEILVFKKQLKEAS